MIWPLIASVYVGLGGVCSTVLIHRHPPTHFSPFEPVAGFAFVVGTILVWPVLAALAIDEGSQS